MIIEVHAVQSFAPSNLNRDDTGNPKEALFGGVRRARISSQSAKRAMRKSPIFKNSVRVPIADRTKHLIPHLVEKLEEKGIGTEWAEKHAAEVISRASLGGSRRALYAQLSSSSGEELETGVAIYISKSEVQEIVDKLVETHQRGEAPDSKEWAKWCRDFSKRIKDRTSAPDIALFGRMLADNPELNIDAGCQVAHAISTHEVNTAEFDYFTAVDDLQSDEESGAGMLGLVAYNSATYYRCARIDWEQLLRNLGGDVELARQTVGAFMRSFALVVPTGMKNSFPQPTCARLPAGCRAAKQRRTIAGERLRETSAEWPVERLRGTIYTGALRVLGPGRRRFSAWRSDGRGLESARLRSGV